MSDASRNLVRFAVATLLLAVGLVLSGSAARATCGDHVRIVTPTVDDDAVPPTPTPCQGPNCTKAPPHQPPLSMPTKVVSAPTEWATGVAATLLGPDVGAGRIVGDTGGRPIHRSSSPFDPPRSR